MTRRGGRSAENDPGLNAVIDADVDATCLVGKTWDFHVETALNTSLDENLEMIRQSMNAAKERGREAMFDCEHFFDGYKSNSNFALDCIQAATEGGASWVVLCDTNGGTLPDEIYEIVSHVHKKCQMCGSAFIATTMLVLLGQLACSAAAGARQVQGTINGLGERCGNANLISLIPTLVLKTIMKPVFQRLICLSCWGCHAFLMIV